MFLITTANQEFWKTDEKILFLGEWCKIYNQKHVWSKLDYETLPYHWNDRKKIHNDYKYLRDVYERYLNNLSYVLNKIHDVDQSLRFWRILIGPWLSSFVEILYDRYQSIITAAQSQRASNVYICTEDEFLNWIPHDFLQFQQWFSTDDYNQNLYSLIIQKLNLIPYTFVKKADNSIRSSTNRVYFVKKYINKVAACFSRYFPHKFYEIIFVNSSFIFLHYIYLQLNNYQIPFLVNLHLKHIQHRIDNNLRNNILLILHQNQFEQLLSKIIPYQIPTAYLERFNSLEKECKNIFFNKPKVIVSNNVDSLEDLPVYWIAKNVENGSKLALIQHGGAYGMSSWFSSEEHQVKIANRFYSWGWSDANLKHIQPMPSPTLEKSKRKIKHDPTGSILFILHTLPRYSYKMGSEPVSDNFIEYLNGSFRFIQLLNFHAFQLILLRLYHFDFGWNDKMRWQDKFPEIQIARTNESMHKQLARSRLSIHAHNSTTYLETFSADYPTIIFWNSDFYELRSSAKRYFNMLESVGIYHRTPESAAEKVNEIYNDPLSWWKQSSIQEVREEFCNIFARTSLNYLSEWKNELLSLKNNNDNKKKI